MRREALERLLSGVRSRRVSVAGAVEALRHMPFEATGAGLLDHHRQLRRGIPEVVYAEGKSAAQVARLFASLAAHGTAIATRVRPDQVAAARRRVPGLRHWPAARVIASTPPPRAAPGVGRVCVVAAGTSDGPVAEEAAVVAELLGNPVDRVYDVGVAGLHRLLAHRATLDRARVVVVVAGMEGALPSVVGGLVRAPIVAVPTSVGYGASYGGLAALLAMLNSCSSGVGVVNIDNGFGAACLATLINRPDAGPGAPPASSRVRRHSRGGTAQMQT